MPKLTFYGMVNGMLTQHIGSNIAKKNLSARDFLTLNRMGQLWD